MARGLLCPDADSNRDALRHHPLKMACLPVSPSGRRPYSQLLYSRAAYSVQRTAERSHYMLTPTTGATGLEPATSRVTVECSNQTELRPQQWKPRLPFQRYSPTHIRGDSPTRTQPPPNSHPALAPVSHSHRVPHSPLSLPLSAVAPTGVEPVSAP